MRIFIFLAFATATAFTFQTAPRLTWKTMQNIKFEKKYYKEIDGEMQSPIFTEEIKKLDIFYCQNSMPILLIEMEDDAQLICKRKLKN